MDTILSFWVGMFIQIFVLFGENAITKIKELGQISIFILGVLYALAKRRTSYGAVHVCVSRLSSHFVQIAATMALDRNVAAMALGDTIVSMTLDTTVAVT
jgi:hypothetical protein